MQKYICLGVLGDDPEETISNNCKLRIAVHDQKNTLWLTVYIFNKILSSSCLQYKKKGDKVIIQGHLEQSTKTGELVVIANDVTFV